MVQQYESGMHWLSDKVGGKLAMGRPVRRSSQAVRRERREMLAQFLQGKRLRPQYFSQILLQDDFTTPFGKC